MLRIIPVRPTTGVSAAFFGANFALAASRMYHIRMIATRYFINGVDTMFGFQGRLSA